MKELAGLENLQTLLLTETEVTDAGLKKLAGLKSLQSLDLQNTKVTEAGVAELRKTLPLVQVTMPRPSVASREEAARLQNTKSPDRVHSELPKPRVGFSPQEPSNRQEPWFQLLDDNKDDILRSSGFNVDLVNLKSSIESYVRFGSQSTADKFLRSDPFDKLEIKKSTKEHRDLLRQKVFLLKRPEFTFLLPDDFEKKGLLAEIPLPMRVRGDKPFHNDVTNYTGALSRMHPADLNPTQFAFLTKTGTLQRCTVAEADIIKNRDGVLYHPERATTTLLLVFKGDVEMLKDIWRNAAQYTAELEISDLRYERPIAWGYYERKAYFEAECDCQKLWMDYLLNPKSPQPVYFATAFGEEDKAKIPEIVWATVKSLRIMDENHRVIGGYRSDVPVK